MRCASCNTTDETGRLACAACGRPFVPVPGTVVPGTVTVPEIVAQRSEPGIRRRDPKTRIADAAPRYGRDLTRYLCIAVHLDPVLAQAVIEGVFGNTRRAFPVSYGVDLGAVAGHALAARQRYLLRDWLLVLSWLVLLVTVVLHSRVALLTLVVMWLIILGELVASHAYVIRNLTPGNFDPEKAPEPLGADQRRRLAEVDRLPIGNVTVYSGYSPFVGNGLILNSWSFSIDIEKGTELGGPARGFTVGEIQQHVIRAVSDLRWIEIETEERLFVNGYSVHNDPRFRPDPQGRPVPMVDADQLHALLENPEGSARHYTAFYVSGWQGHLVLAVFLRFVRRPRSLFVETSFSLLPPLDERFYAVDAQHGATAASAVFGALLQFKLLRTAVRVAPERLVRCFGRIGQPVVRSLTAVMREAAERRAVAGGRYDFGAPPTIRELASAKKYRFYFQQLDKEMYLKVIENRVLDAVVDFLDERGVDTRSLVERQTTILNSGVMVTGNARLDAGSVAAGEGASAQTFLRQFRRPGGEGRGRGQ